MWPMKREGTVLVGLIQWYHLKFLGHSIVYDIIVQLLSIFCPKMGRAPFGATQALDLGNKTTSTLSIGRP